MKNRYVNRTLGTWLLLTGLLAAPVFNARAQYAGFSTWTNAAGDLLWSNPLNWSPNGVPTDTSEVDFVGSATTPLGLGATNIQGNVNCIVDIDASVTNMFFNVTNPFSHTILINPGRTLRMVNNPNVTSGQLDKFTIRPSVPAPPSLEATNAVAYVTIRGAGWLIIGDTNVSPTLADGARIHINGQNPSASTVGSHMATMDLSGLDNFAFAMGSLRVGASASGAAGNRGTLILAKTNLVMCGDTTVSTASGGLMIGNGSFNNTGNYDSTGDIQLGQENVFLIINAKVGGARTALGTLRFQSGLINPTFKWRGLSGISPADTISIGDSFNAANNAAYNNSSTTGRVDLVSGTVDIMVANLNVGRNFSGTGATSSRALHGDGTLTWAAGPIAVTTLAVGSQAANNAGNVTGVVNVYSNATLLADSVSIGRDSGNAAGTGNGTMNIAYGGSVTVTNGLREDSATVTGTSRVNLTNGTLTVGGLVRVDNLAVANSVLNLTISPTINNANPVCDVTNLTLLTSVTLNVSGANLSLARYPLIRYRGAIGGGGYAVATLGTQPVDTFGYLTNNTVASTIDLVITNVPAARWKGNVNGNWDINTTINWVNSVNNVATTYKETVIPGDLVIFDDAATGTKTVNLTTTLSPTSVLVGGTNNYSFGGSGGISGTTGLSKNGSGTLTLSNTGPNNFTGTTVVSAGTLRVNGSLSGSSSITVQTGATLDGTGTIASPVTVNSGGTLAAGSGAGLATLNVNNGLNLQAGSSTVLDVNSDTLASDSIFFGGSSVTYGGTLVVNLTGANAGITAGAAIPLFTGGAYSGSFAAIVPAYPALGYYWDTTTLAGDGMLRIQAIPVGTELYWTNATGGDLLWSNPANWIRTNSAYAGSQALNSVPAAADRVNFYTTNGGVFTATNGPGLVNNIVDTDTAVTELFYGSILPGYHTTQINPGVTLTVTAAEGAQTLSLRPTAISNSTLAQVTIRGAGRLVVGDTNNPFTSADMRIHISSTSVGDGTYWATMDMSGLDYFAGAPGFLRVGGSGSSSGTHGTWLMAKTNLLILGAPAAGANGIYGLVIGQTTFAGDDSSAGDVQLGQENVLRLAALRVGGSRATNNAFGGPGGGIGGASQAGAGGAMEFRSGLVNPTLTVRAIDGVSAAAVVAIGDNFYANASSTNTATGDLNLTGGTVDILATDVLVGRNNSVVSNTRNGGGKGTLTWTAGTINASSVSVGSQAANNLGNVTGVVNVRSNALLQVTGAINIGADAGNFAGTGAGTLNVVYGGVAEVATDVAENNASGQNGTSSINLTNGFLSTGGQIVVDNVNVISGVISNTGPLTAGRVTGGGTISGPVTVTNLLAPGASIGTLTIFNSLTMASTTTNVFEVNTDTLAHDLVTGLTSVTYAGTLVILPSGIGGAITNGASAQLFNAASYAGSFAAIVPAVPAPGFAWDTSQLTVNGTLKIVTSVATNPTNLTFAVIGNSLDITWPATHTGWRLEGQTNAPTAGLSTNWFSVPGSAGTNHVIMPLNPANGSVFYRLVYP